MNEFERYGDITTSHMPPPDTRKAEFIARQPHAVTVRLHATAMLLLENCCFQNKLVVRKNSVIEFSLITGGLDRMSPRYPSWINRLPCPQSSGCRPRVLGRTSCAKDHELSSRAPSSIADKAGVTPCTDYHNRDVDERIDSERSLTIALLKFFCQDSTMLHSGFSGPFTRVTIQYQKINRQVGYFKGIA
jgi:hypothetical protein